MCEPGTGLRAQLLMDPGDDVRITHGLLERHDPPGGLVVVHPTPGVWAPSAFGHDLLAALGRAVNRLGEEHLDGMIRVWQAATVWMAVDRIADLVVLRADRFSPGTWRRVLALCRATGTRLLLVCHTARLPRPLLDVLADIEHRILPTDLGRREPITTTVVTSDPDPDPRPAPPTWRASRPAGSPITGRRRSAVSTPPRSRAWTPPIGAASTPHATGWAATPGRDRPRPGPRWRSCS